MTRLATGDGAPESAQSQPRELRRRNRLAWHDFFHFSSSMCPAAKFPCQGHASNQHHRHDHDARPPTFPSALPATRAQAH
jgi:hypothetical protein